MRETRRKSLVVGASIFLLAILLVSGFLGFVIPYANSGFPSNSVFAYSSQPTTNNGTLRLTLVGLPDTLNQLNASQFDPFKSTVCVSCRQIISLENAFGQPVLQNGTVNTEAGLFSTVTSSANATVWVFTIRAGAKWSDGVPITSSDINFTFGLESKYLMGTFFDFVGLTIEIQSLQIINSSTTQFILNIPNSQFGSIISSQYYFAPVPAHILEPLCQSAPNPTACYDNQLNFAQDVTSGPFYHENYTFGSSIMVLKANPYYWNLPKLSEIIVNFISNDTASASLLKQGESNLALINPVNATSFVNVPGYGVDVEPDRSLLYMEYNITNYPFDQLPFREAISSAINTSTIVQSVYHGYATPGYLAGGLIPPSATMWHNTSVVKYEYDLALSKSNLTSLGFKYSTNGNVLEYSNGTAVSFTVFTDTNNTGDLQAARIVQGDLQSLGMNVSQISGSLSHILVNYTAGSLAPPPYHSNIDNEIFVGSTQSPVFGLGYISALPAFDNYFPWSMLAYRQPNWILPSSAEAEYYSLLSKANTSTDQTLVQQSIRNIDGLNSEYLPVIVLAYPDAIWAYSSGSFNGFPNSTSPFGFDMGGYALDPLTFSGIGATCQPNCRIVSITTTSATMTSSTINSTRTSSSSASSSSTVNTSPPNSVLLLGLAIIVVIALIALGTFVSRRRSKRST